MTLFLTDADVRASFAWPAAVEALRAAYGADVGERRYPARTMARGTSSWLRTLSGVCADSGVMGAKLIAAAPGSRRAAYLIPLFDESSAELVALLDGHSVTGFRTAATSALAADLLAPDGRLDVAVIGSGFEAQNHLRALAAGRELARVRVFSPNPDSRARFAAAVADVAPGVEPVEAADHAVTGANLVLCAARSRDERPTLLGRWLSRGTTVISVGSTLPEQREVDAEVLGKADLIVADMVAEVLHDTGDMIAAGKAGVDVAARTVALADVVTGRTAGRGAEDQILVYKSVGSAVQDLAVAVMCLRRSRELGLGTKLPVTVHPVQK